MRTWIEVDVELVASDFVEHGVAGIDIEGVLEHAAHGGLDRHAVLDGPLVSRVECH